MLMLINKVNKIMLNGLLLSLVISCNVVVSPTTNSYQISSEKQLGKLLNFESRVKYEGLEVDKAELKTERIKLDLDVLDSGTDKIKIPVYGEFNLIFESSNVYRISDNDASDGEARVQLPSEVLEMYINTKYTDNESNTSLKIEDKLYYLSDNLAKDKTYRLGKRLFPIPNDWHSEDKERYVLRLKNNGISKADIKFYKSDVVDYPSGIKEIGEEGGVIELRGVGRLEIPKGSIPKKTVVVMKQELQGREPLDLGSSHSDKRMPLADYVSPLVRIEPMGLKLKKDATLSLDYVDLKRLGNNHPRVLHYRFSLDQDHWYGFSMYSDLPLKEWTPYLPAKIDEFGYYSKFILKWNQPTSNIQAELENNINQDQFSIKDDENDFNVLAIPSKMEFDIQNITDKSKLSELKSRANYTYTMFSKLGYKLTKCEQDKNGYIISLFDKSFLPENARAATYKDENRDKTICSRIAISKESFPSETALEHELWHSFQYSNINVSYVDSKKMYWIREGTADYMGAKAYESNKRSLKLKNDEKQIYIETLNLGINELVNTIIDRPILNSDVSGYDAWGLFNTISRLEKTDGDKSSMKAFEDFYGSLGSTKLNSKSKYLKHYHDYAVDSFISTQKNYEKKLGKLFVYNPTQQISPPESTVSSDNVISTQFVKNNLKSENPIRSIKGELNNFATKYFKIKAGDVKQTELKIRVKNISEGLNITPVLFSKDKNEFVYVPRKRVLNTKTKRYDYTGEYEIYTSDFDLSDASNDKLSFGKNTGSVVLALSYANPNKLLTDKGTYDIEIGYNCPKLADDKKSNKNVGILEDSTCYKEKDFK